MNPLPLILDAVQQQTKCKRTDFIYRYSHHRTWPRRFACWLALELTGLPEPTIAQALHYQPNSVGLVHDQFAADRRIYPEIFRQTESVRTSLFHRFNHQFTPSNEAERFLYAFSIAVQIPVVALTARGRYGLVCWPRMIAMVLAAEACPQLHPVYVARTFRRDRGTLTHAIEAVKDRCATEPAAKAQVDQLRARLFLSVPSVPSVS